MAKQRENPFDLTGKVAVIIGGTSGIGLAISEALHHAGATVVPSSRRDAAVKRAVERFCRPGFQTLVCPVDVNSSASLENLRDRVLAAYGRVDILVNLKIDATIWIPLFHGPECATAVKGRLSPAMGSTT